MSQQQFFIKLPHQATNCFNKLFNSTIRAFSVDEHAPLTINKLKKLIISSSTINTTNTNNHDHDNNNNQLNCFLEQQLHVVVVNNKSNNNINQHSFNLNANDGDDEIIPISDGTILEIRVKLCGGGNTPSSSTSSSKSAATRSTTDSKIEKLNDDQPVNVKIDQQIDRNLSEEVKSKIIFNPDTVPQSDCYQIPIHEFIGNEWKVKTIPKTVVTTNLSSFKVLTYNVWFDLQDREDRMLKIIEICQLHNADILCLQEMTKGTLEIMSKLSYIRDNFYISDSVEFGSKTVMPYGVSIFIKKNMPMTRMFINKLPTNMSRWAMSVELMAANSSENSGGAGELMCFTTVHLESLNNQSLRAQQLFLISSFSKFYGTSLVCGDFNFDSERNYGNSTPLPLENDNLPNFFPEHLDIWKELKYPENQLGKTHGDGSRYDRIILKSNSFEATEITLLGDTPFKTKQVKSGNVDVFPSDHCGLVVTLSKTKEK